MTGRVPSASYVMRPGPYLATSLFLSADRGLESGSVDLGDQIPVGDGGPQLELVVVLFGGEGEPDLIVDPMRVPFAGRWGA